MCNHDVNRLLDEDNKKISKKIQDSKIFKWFIKGLAVFNLYEGIIHLVIAVIGLWGCWATGTWDWRVLAPVVENTLFGFFSVFTGIVLGKGFHHH